MLAALGMTGEALSDDGSDDDDGHEPSTVSAGRASDALQVELRHSFLAWVPLFKAMTAAELDEIADAMVDEEYEYEDIVEQGDEGDSLFVIRQGTAVVEKDGVVVATYGPGDYFGERALLSGEPRGATVRAEGAVHCMRLGREPFKELMGECAHVAALFEESESSYAVVKIQAVARGWLVRERLMAAQFDSDGDGDAEQAEADASGAEDDESEHTSSQTRGRWGRVRFLEKVPLMQALTHAELRKVADAMAVEEYEEEEIVTQGEDGDSLYIIEKGQAVVEKDGVVVATYGPGDYFGEVSLMTGEPRGATVRATDEVACLRLGQASFKDLMGQCDHVAALFDEQKKKYRRIQSRWSSINGQTSPSLAKPTMAPQAHRGRQRGRDRAAAAAAAVEMPAAGGTIPESIPPAGASIDSTVSSIGSAAPEDTGTGSSAQEQDQRQAVELFSDDVVYYHDGGTAKKKEIAVLWDHVDADDSGSLERGEIHGVLVELGLDAEEQDVEAAMAQLDRDGDGEISFEEFASWYLSYADESASQAATTVSGLAQLAASGDIDDETYMWTEALGDDWLTYAQARALVGRTTFEGLPARPVGVEDGAQSTQQDSEVATESERSSRPASTVTHTAVVHYQDGGAARTEEIQALWTEVDVDQSGGLDRAEVQALLTRLAVAEDEMDVDAAIDVLDKDKDGTIDFHEFVSWFLQWESESGANQHTSQTTVGGLLCGRLVESGVVTDETYMWVEGLSDDWLTYADAKELLPTEAECRLAMEAEMEAEMEAAALTAAHKRTRAMQIIGTLDFDSPVYYHVVRDPAQEDDEPQRLETTVGGLAELVKAGDVTDDSMMWAEGMGESWLPYGVVKSLLPGPKASDGVVTLRITQADGSVQERTATVGEVTVLLATGEIDGSSEVRMEGEATFQTLAAVRDASSPKSRGSPSKDGENAEEQEEELGNSLAGFGAAMEQANAEAWEHTEVRRLQAAENLKETEQQIEEKQALIAQAQQTATRRWRLS
jgi:CRP-like cAMP-binding protein/Ca2+-binding EF-hand superfamily protein